MANLTPEEAAKIAFRAEELCSGVLSYLSERKVQREEALTALQMALAVVAAQMGVSLSDMTATLVQNMPVFYRKLAQPEAEPPVNNPRRDN